MFKKICLKIKTLFLDSMAVIILGSLGLACVSMLKTLYNTPMGAILLTLLGAVISVVWACHRVFTKDKK